MQKRASDGWKYFLFSAVSVARKYIVFSVIAVTALAFSLSEPINGDATDRESSKEQIVILGLVGKSKHTPTEGKPSMQLS